MQLRKAVILAAGKGERLLPLTKYTPKPLLTIGDKCIIDRVIGNIQAYSDVDEILVAVSEDAYGKFREHFNENKSQYRCRITPVSTEQKETSGDLKYVLDEKGITTGKVIVSYGDVFTEIDVRKLVEYHNRCNVAATMSVFQVPDKDVERLGIARLRKVNGIYLVEDFVEKPKLEEAQSNWANACYYILNLDKLYSRLRGDKVKIEEYLFPELAKERQFAAFKLDAEFWIDIGTPVSYDEANRIASEL